jgi:AcrR family transcriptional regulator
VTGHGGLHVKRVVKDPNIRREELVDIAEELFLENGYEETPVSDIVKKAQVAQGTFYYYFESKDEILDAIVDRYLNEFVRDAGEQVKRDDISAVEKMISFFKTGSRFSVGRKKLVNYLHEEKNALLHLKIEQKGSALIVPLLTDVIEQGAREGLFKTKYPRETALLILGCQDSLFDIEHFSEKTAEEKKRTVEAAFNIIERVLGVEQGSLVKEFLHMVGMYEKQ